MAVATQLQPASSLPPEFNAFLFARIDEVACATPLSVLSALARLDLDPWLEAAELTQLPKKTAVQRLTTLLTKLPGGPPADEDPQTIASRLISLLPGPAGPAIGWSAPGEFDIPGGINLAIVMMFFMLIIMIVTTSLRLGKDPMPVFVNGTDGSARERGLPKLSPVQIQP